MTGKGRGRGEATKISEIEEEGAERYPAAVRPGGIPVLEVDPDSSSSSDAEKTIRGRGGYKQIELHTIPPGITKIKAANTDGGQPIDVLTNFVQITPMEQRMIYKYRVDFKPEIESVSLRRKLFTQATEKIFECKVIYDGASDARSSQKVCDELKVLTTRHPLQLQIEVTINLRFVGTVLWGSFEMIRVYNMHMKQFLRAMGFYQVNKAGAYIHPDLSTPIGQSRSDLMTVRGYRTAANIHQGGNMLMNLESAHKLMQNQNVLQNMTAMRSMGGNIQQIVKAQLIGKLVVTSYNKVVYRVEDVNFEMNPRSTFFDKKEKKELSYMEYYHRRYDIPITEVSQPLLLVIPNNRRQGAREESDEPRNDIYLVPELCNIAGLTDGQKTDNRLKVDLIRSSQIPPEVRVRHLKMFLEELHKNKDVSTTLNEWGYSYDKEPVKIRGRILPLETIGVGVMAGMSTDKWPKVDHMGGFDSLIINNQCAKLPDFPQMHILIGRNQLRDEDAILSKLRSGFMKVGLKPQDVKMHRMTEGDSSNIYVQHLKKLPQNSVALVILQAQNKERYDAIKKHASVEKGMITQVVTARLMMDDRKAGGAGVKIGVQMAAKIGGEPWYVNLPMKTAMICGYDTYHDTANRGRSYGAFLASLNERYSRWYSKADSHERLDELSSHMTENLSAALVRYRELNDTYPERVIIYRDGVGDGQLEHVYNTELRQIKDAITAVSENIRLAFIVVNKRVGARFYMRSGPDFKNCPPGSVIDDVVTREHRYDFYLISQSTRNGTVAPTYYNIIHDNSGLDVVKQQMLAYKMCLLYYNWTGTVRVPAPCQYAHKLALLCGEHLHSIPNTILDDRLHFL